MDIKFNEPIISSNNSALKEIAATLVEIEKVLLHDQKLCKLLRVGKEDPYAASFVNPESLKKRNLLFKPYVDLDKIEGESCISLLFDSFTVNQFNKKFDMLVFRIDIVSPKDVFDIKGFPNRPLAIANQVDLNINNRRFTSLGMLERYSCIPYTPVFYASGYSLSYKCIEAQ